MTSSHMDGTAMHGRHIQQMVHNIANAKHDTLSSKVRCSTACCMGLANVMSLLASAGEQVPLHEPTNQVYELVAQVGVSVTHTIITPPPRLMPLS